MPLLRRLAGVALIGAAFAPVHRLLDPARTGPAGEATRAAAEVAWTLGLSGTLIVLTLCWLWVRMVPVDRVRLDRIGHRVAVPLSRPSSGGFALALGTFVAMLCALTAWQVHGLAPTSVDEMAQLLHASALMRGRLTVPVEGTAAAWVVQNGVLTEGGWASIYPPLHTVLLALGMSIGAAWLAGPLMTGVATGLVTLAAERSLGVVPGRVTGLLLVVSPFWLLLGASHLSHTSAAAGLALVLFASMRAREAGILWHVLAGVGVGVAVCARPWVGLTSSIGILAAVHGANLLGAVRSDTLKRRGMVTAVAGIALGGLPFAILLFAWNSELFGAPGTLGYTVAFGPAHGLGLHVDPWGNRYGVVEALAYSGADLVQLGIRLFESPLPVMVILGAALLIRPLPTGALPFAAWAGAAVGANALYWHHGIHMGPRMLYESTPAWVALLVAAGVPLFKAQDTAAPSTGLRFARTTLLAAVLSGLLLAPSVVRGPRLASDGVTTGAAIVESAMDEATDGPILVFVHGSWASRVASRLVATGMRRDSIETALRRNDICSVDQYARARTGEEALLPTLDFAPLPGSPPHLQSRLLSEGNRVRVSPAVTPDGTCVREARSDRLGVLELELLGWRAAPFPDADVLFARDLGPGTNLKVLEAVERPAYVFVDSPNGQLLLDYDEGIELLWGGAAGAVKANGGPEG